MLGPLALVSRKIRKDTALNLKKIGTLRRKETIIFWLVKLRQRDDILNWLKYTGVLCVAANLSSIEDD